MAVVATAAGEKLLMGRLPARNWICRTISSLFLCRKLRLFFGKSTKTAATRAALFDSNMHQIVCRLGLRTRPHWGAYSALPAPQLYLGGPTSKGKAGSSSFALGRKKKSVPVVGNLGMSV